MRGRAVPAEPECGGHLGAQPFRGGARDRAEPPVREFEAFRDLYRLATGWPRPAWSNGGHGATWIPLFGALEERGFQVMLVDPRRILPGRKTDVLDCQWLQQLHTYGLLSGAFRPDAEIRRLRSYLRSGPCWWSTRPTMSSTCRKR